MNKSTLRTISILEYLAELKRPAEISQISRELDIPKSSVFDIIQALLEKGFVEVDNDVQKTFKLGLRAFQIGSAYINNVSVYKIAHPILEKLKDEINETVYLAVEDKGRIVYLDKVESDSPIRSTCDIGSTNLMHLTGLGKAMLAGYPEERVREITGGGSLEVRTPQTIKDYDSLLVHLKKIREKGYSIDDREDTELVCCVAAPIYDKSDNVIAAISVSMLSTKFTMEREKYISKRVVEKALEISRKMGYMRDKLYDM